MPAENVLTVPPYPAEEKAAPSVVAVTGSTGYLAGSIVQRLLALGHTVHGTCRDPKKATALQALPGAVERLKLFKADLLTEGSFDEALEGCQYVVHCASPYVIDVPKHLIVEKLIKPAIQGTENVLGSVNKVSTIKRVVLTSSCAAVYGSPIERGVDHVFTEADWSITPTESVLPYYYSKREAERSAWAVCEKQDRWDLVTINPPGIFGPPLTDRADGTSLGIVKQIFNGEMAAACPKLGMGVVDVRDVAAAHSLALFTPSAKGRYVCCAETVQISDMVKIFAKEFPGRVKAPGFSMPKWLLWLIGPAVGFPRDIVTHGIGLPGPFFSSEKAKAELGLRFLDFTDTLKDMGNSMTELKLVK